MSTIQALKPAELEILEFSRARWRYEGAKKTAVLERFGLPITHYYQLLDRIIDEAAAEVYDPGHVRRLRAERSRRRALRTRRTS